MPELPLALPALLLALPTLPLALPALTQALPVLPAASLALPLPVSFAARNPLVGLAPSELSFDPVSDLLLALSDIINSSLIRDSP